MAGPCQVSLASWAPLTPASQAPAMQRETSCSAADTWAGRCCSDRELPALTAREKREGSAPAALAEAVLCLGHASSRMELIPRLCHPQHSTLSLSSSAGRAVCDLCGYWDREQRWDRPSPQNAPRSSRHSLHSQQLFLRFCFPSCWNESEGASFKQHRFGGKKGKSYWC